MIIEVGNFTGNANELVKIGKEKFIATFEGSVDSDVLELWEIIENKAENVPTNKAEKAPKTK